MGQGRSTATSAAGMLIGAVRRGGVQVESMWNRRSAIKPRLIRGIAAHSRAFVPTFGGIAVEFGRFQSGCRG